MVKEWGESLRHISLFERSGTVDGRVGRVVRCAANMAGHALGLSGARGATRCTLTGSSGLEGGAILNDGTLLMENSTLTGNNGTYGGALQCRYFTTLNNCTITGNSAGNGGGGVFNKYYTLTNNNCIIAGNTPVMAGSDLYSQLAALVYVNTNLIQSILEDRPSAADIGLAPLTGNPLLAPLGNYGGPTQTMPPLGGSPAIDAGGPTALTIDQRGFPRVSGLAPDLGAVEAQVASQPLVLMGASRPGNGPMQFQFTNLTGGSFTVYASTNVASPFNTWSNLGPAIESPPGSGQFQFSDPQATNSPQRFYQVHSP
jgi:hypothetical protein